MQEIPNEAVLNSARRWFRSEQEAIANITDPTVREDEQQEMDVKVHKLCGLIQDAMGEVEGRIIYDAIERHVKHILGKVLTMVDASFSDREQRKAMKDLIRQQFYGELKYACEAYTGSLLLSAGEHDPLLTHAIAVGRLRTEAEPIEDLPTVQGRPGLSPR